MSPMSDLDDPDLRERDIELQDQPPEVGSLEPGCSDSLPPAKAAAERVVEFVQWFGDGEVYGQAGTPPLYARDLEALARNALGVVVAEQQRDALAAAVDRVRRRHPRGDEEPGYLAPGLWCPGCGHERADSGYGGCPDRMALIVPGFPLRGNQ